jgi:TRAP-type C4-dicarboxylate transport system substrate-binding protein
MEDVQGMKIRTPSRTGGWLLEAMGAVPVGAPVPAIPEMLSKKVVDAVMIPFEISVPLKTHEMVDFHTVLDDPRYPRPNTSTFLLAMNKNSYAKLPPELKKVIDDNSGRNIARMAGEVWTRVEEPGERLAKASGELIKMAPAEVKRLREKVEGPVQERWVQEVKGKGIDGEALLREAKALMAKYSQ